MSEPKCKRLEGERIRARHAVDILKAVLSQVEATLADDVLPIGADTPQTVATAAYVLVASLNRMDAYDLAERRTTAPGHAREGSETT